MNEEEYIRSLYPLNVTEVTGHRVVNQIYEGLVSFDQKDLSVNPSLASSWDIDSTGMKYVFHLRNDVYYHDDPCFAATRRRNVQNVFVDRTNRYSNVQKSYRLSRHPSQGHRKAFLPSCKFALHHHW